MHAGKLFVVGTPIGNRADMTFRAVEILKSVDTILCEDTRTTKNLLSHYDIHTPTKSYHAHSAEGADVQIVDELEQGKRMALVTDAGMPTISDPGSSLVNAVLSKLGSESVEIIPGPDAITSALARSGFPVAPYLFLGFVPAKKGRETFFKTLDDREETIVFYESTHKILKTFESLAKNLGDRPVALVREITKIYEETIRGTASEILEALSNYPEKAKGEHVVVIAPKGFTIGKLK